MNLYAVMAAYSPESHIFLGPNDEWAMEQGVFEAARDACGNCFSPDADVYVIARDIEKIGTARAIDAPEEWKWAHPGVENATAEAILLSISDIDN